MAKTTTHKDLNDIKVPQLFNLKEDWKGVIPPQQEGFYLDEEDEEPLQPVEEYMDECPAIAPGIEEEWIAKAKAMDAAELTAFLKGVDDYFLINEVAQRMEIRRTYYEATQKASEGFR